MFNENEFDEIADELSKTAEQLRDKYFLNSCIVIGSFTSSEDGSTHKLAGKMGNSYEIVGMMEFTVDEMKRGDFDNDE